MREKISKLKQIDHLRDSIDLLLQDIDHFLKQDEEYEGVTTMSIVRMKELFRGWITKNWINPTEPQPKKLHSVNKLIVKRSVIFYLEAWKHRNEVRHNPKKYKEFIHKWNHNVKEKIENDNRPEVRKYVRM